jgi:hypothetical protein
VEAREQVVGARQREEVGHLLRADLVDLEADVALERRDPAVLLEPVRVAAASMSPTGLNPVATPVSASRRA